MKNDNPNVFISRPTYVDPKCKEGLNHFIEFVEKHGLTPRTIGVSDYPTHSPMDDVIRVMRECCGAIILGYPQILVKNGFIKDQTIPTQDIKELLLATEWNHIEAGLAYALGLPLLVIHHKGVSRGIFDRGAINSFLYSIDFTDPNWPELENVQGAFSTWEQAALKIEPEKTLPELSVDLDLAKQIGLEQHLAKQGYRLFGGDLSKLDSYLLFGDYERIVWTDNDGNKYLLTSPKGKNIIMLKTRYSPEEIDQRIKDRLHKKS